MPIGPYETFAECVTAQQSKGEDEESAKRICGAMERDASATTTTTTTKYTNSRGKFFVRAFLIDPSLNINKWAVTEESIPRNINTFIGKPLVLTEGFDHPGADSDTLNHWLSFQETYRVGTIIDIIPKKNPDTGSTAYHAIIEVTNNDLKASLQNNSVPVYVSPAIAEPAATAGNGLAISEWTGMHLAIVDEPAFGVKKAVISETCGGDKAGCLMQLRKAHVNRHGIGHCGFCVKEAMQKYRRAISFSQKLLDEAIKNNNKFDTSQARKTSPNHSKPLSQLEAMDSNASENNKEHTIEKIEEPNNNKQPVTIPGSNTTPTHIKDLLAENQKLLHELELRELKIQELSEAHSTVQERIAALELRDRRKDIERIVTPDVIKDDKARLDKIQYLVASSIPISQIEEVYKDLKITIKKASVNQRAYGGKVPYVTSNLSTTNNNNYNTQLVDDDTGLTPLQKQLAVLKGGI
jgi:hypothetical protein